MEVWVFGGMKWFQIYSKITILWLGVLICDWAFLSQTHCVIMASHNKETRHNTSGELNARSHGLESQSSK